MKRPRIMHNLVSLFVAVQGVSLVFGGGSGNNPSQDDSVSNLLESLWASLKHGLQPPNFEHASAAKLAGQGNQKLPRRRTRKSRNNRDLPHAGRRRSMLVHSLQQHYSRQLSSLSSNTDNNLLLNQTISNISEALYTYLYPSSSNQHEKTHPDRTTSLRVALPPFPPSAREANLKRIRDMFAHAYDSYMLNAYPEGEIRPIDCEPGIFDLIKLPALTLIDTLDTLLVLGNTTEFARSVERLRILNNQTKGGMFAVDENVSVFETNIRVLGGLLSAHQMAVAFMSQKVLESEVWDKDKDRILWEHYPTLQDGDNTCSPTNSMNLGEQNKCESDIEKDMQQCSESSDCVATESDNSGENKYNTSNDQYWVYDGFLLKLAHDIGSRLLPAFRSKTGIPFGTVNLLNGIPKGETTVASLAGGGTLTLEMELLSRLTGDSSFGKAAKLASRALWMRRSHIDLVGKHIDIQNGHWTETLSGVGSNSDSFFEYLTKHYMLFPEDDDFWIMFQSAYGGLHRDARIGEWYMDVDMNLGLKMGTSGGRRIFESLAAFYPGMQTLLGELVPAARSLNSFFMVREFLGALPERFDYGMWRTDINRDGAGKHPLRPELLESCYLLHRSTKGIHSRNKTLEENETSGWLWAADFALHALDSLTNVRCGFASLRDVSSITTGAIGASVKTKGVRFMNEMPSFFLSETLKYLYLTFDDKNILHEDDDREWIFTTEAHPIHHVHPAGNSSMRRFERIREAVKERLVMGTNQLNRTNIHHNVKRLERQKWTETSSMKTYQDDIENVTKEISNKKGETRRQFRRGRITDFFGDADLIDYLGDTAIANDVFGESTTGQNIAHLSLKNVGLGDGMHLRKACPNFYADDLLWLRAINGGALDYSDVYVSSTKDEPVGQQSQFVLLGAADALGFHGSGVYLGRSGEEVDEKCFIDSHTIDNSSPSATPQQRTGPRISSAYGRGERIDMGGDLGVFEVSSFSEGSGFYMEHIETGESIMATFIVDDSGGDNTSHIYVMTYATVPDVKFEARDENYGRADESPWRLVGPSWASLFMSTKQIKVDPVPIISPPERTVVMADFAGNAFVCDVKIIKRSVVIVNISQEENLSIGDESAGSFEDVVLARYPCAPALFGPTHLSRLLETNGVLVEEEIRPPHVNDEFGCEGALDEDFMDNIVDLDLDEPSKTKDVRQEEDIVVEKNPDELIEGDNSKDAEDDVEQAPIIQVIYRGRCTFRAKAVNQMKHSNAVAVIVINTEEEDLFVMSHGREEDYADGQIPVSVLVSGMDGEDMLQQLESDDSEADSHYYVAQVSLLPQKGRIERSGKILADSDDEVDWPIVRGSNDALQIFAEGGWGVHAVPRTSSKDKTVPQSLDWQLFLLRHT